MDMYERINAGEYKPQMEYPGYLAKPFLRKVHQGIASYAAEYAAKLVEYEAALPEHTAKMNAYNAEQNRLNAKFKADAIDDVFGDDAKRYPAIVEALWEVAWDAGHSDGLTDVYSHLVDYTGIVDAIKKEFSVK